MRWFSRHTQIEVYRWSVMEALLPHLHVSGRDSWWVTWQDHSMWKSCLMVGPRRWSKNKFHSLSGQKTVMKCKLSQFFFSTSMSLHWALAGRDFGSYGMRASHDSIPKNFICNLPKLKKYPFYFAVKCYGTILAGLTPDCPRGRSQYLTRGVVTKVGHVLPSPTVTSCVDSLQHCVCINSFLVTNNSINECHISFFLSERLCSELSWWVKVRNLTTIDSVTIRLFSAIQVRCSFRVVIVFLGCFFFPKPPQCDIRSISQSCCSATRSKKREKRLSRLWTWLRKRDNVILDTVNDALCDDTSVCVSVCVGRERCWVAELTSCCTFTCTCSRSHFCWQLLLRGSYIPRISGHMSVSTHHQLHVPVKIEPIKSLTSCNTVISAKNKYISVRSNPVF